MDPFLQGGLSVAWFVLTKIPRISLTNKKYAQPHFKKRFCKPFYTQKKRTARKLETRQWGTVCSVLGKVSKALVFYCTVTPQTVDPCTDFSVPKFLWFLFFFLSAPPHLPRLKKKIKKSCRDLFFFFFRLFWCLFLFYFDTILCCDVT